MENFNGLICATNSKKQESIYIKTATHKDLFKVLISYAFEFSYSNENFHMPLDYIADWLDPSFEEETLHYVYIEYLSSTIEKKDFYIEWDNYMKVYGRGHFT